MNDGLMIGVMILPEKKRHQEKMFEKLNELRKANHNINLVYFNWKTKLDDLVYSDEKCIIEESLNKKNTSLKDLKQIKDEIVNDILETLAEKETDLKQISTLEIPCYHNDLFDIIVDIPGDQPTLHDITNAPEFIVFEEICDMIISPLFEDISDKMCSYECVKKAVTDRFDHHEIDTDGRIKFEFRN